MEQEQTKCDYWNAERLRWTDMFAELMSKAKLPRLQAVVEDLQLIDRHLGDPKLLNDCKIALAHVVLAMKSMLADYGHQTESDPALVELHEGMIQCFRGGVPVLERALAQIDDLDSPVEYWRRESPRRSVTRSMSVRDTVKYAVCIFESLYVDYAKAAKATERKAWLEKNRAAFAADVNAAMARLEARRAEREAKSAARAAAPGPA